MTDMIVEIMVEVLRILAIATKEVNCGRFSELISCMFTLPRLIGCSEKYFKKLTGNRDIEDSLERLDKLTQEEARMASAEQLKMTHSVDGKVMDVDDRVRGIEGQVQGVRNEVQDICGDVQDVRGDVQDVRVDVQDVRGDLRNVGNLVQDVDDKLDQANRSLSFQSLIVIRRAQTASQGTSSEIVSCDGFRPQIHPPIITLHAKPIIMAQLNGFSTDVYIICGNLLAPSCGYTENVCYIRPSSCDDS
jgi:uncharacterized protein YoxC